MASCGGCEPATNAPDCDPACGQGFVCNHSLNVCTSGALEGLDGAPGGRAARVIYVDGRPLVASISPDQRIISVGAVDPQDLTRTDWRVLSRTVRPSSARLAVATNRERVAVAWIDQDNAFRVATRAATGSPNWSIEPIKSVEFNNDIINLYNATDDFDVALDQEGNPEIAFRDRRERALFSLTRADSNSGARWHMQLIDDGTTARSSACDQSVRALRRRGLGYEPDLLQLADQRWVLYHDADCGDLRFARATNESNDWEVRVLDHGSEGLSDAQGQMITGRYPSGAIDAAGRLGISYQDVSRARLMFGLYSPELNVFSSQIVDPGEEIALTGQRAKRVVGAFSSLSFDLEGRARIAYLDATRMDLMTARSLTEPQGVDDDVWTLAAVDESGITGLFADHATSEDGLSTVFVSEHDHASTRGPAVRSHPLRTRGAMR